MFRGRLHQSPDPVGRLAVPDLIRVINLRSRISGLFCASLKSIRIAVLLFELCGSKCVVSLILPKHREHLCLCFAVMQEPQGVRLLLECRSCRYVWLREWHLTASLVE